MSNSNLRTAKRLKNDEFYTIYEDIEKECIHYKKYFTDKTIYCNCDDYEQSNFVKYFTDNFQNFGLKKLIATCYIKDGKGKYFEYNGQNKTVYNLDSNGDFRSVECKKILEEADIIITNPPFSLFREYVAQLMEYGKQFLIIGNGNAVTYKEIYSLIKDNKMWWGQNYVKKFLDYSTNELKKFGNVIWYTNLNVEKEIKLLPLTKTYNEIDYPKYDNYNAIEVSKIKDIPIDFDGVMGVPITFLHKYNPEQYEILGIMSGAKGECFVNGNDNSPKFTLNGKGVYTRIIIFKKK